MLTILVIAALVLIVIIGVAGKSDEAKRKRELEDAELKYHRSNS